MTDHQKEQFALYGDVLLMDVTHRTNKFRVPFCGVAGVDGNGSTVLFAQALIRSENQRAFEFVLKNLKRSAPDVVVRTILTDADAAEAAAIREIFPTASHFRCQWHLTRDVSSFATRLGEEKRAFLRGFAECQYSTSAEEFYRLWQAFQQRWSPKGPDVERYLRHLHADHPRWAGYILRHSFTLGMSSTQRIEGLWAKIKTKLNHTTSLCGMHSAVSRITDDHAKLQGIQALERPRPPPHTSGRRAEIFQFFLRDVAATCTTYTHQLIMSDYSIVGQYVVTELDVERDFMQMNLLRPQAMGNSEPTNDLSGETADLDAANTTTELLQRVQEASDTMSAFAVVNNLTETTNVVMVDDKRTTYLCSCLHGVRYGLPCRHVLAVAFQRQWRLTLAVVHPRWFKKDRRFYVRVEQPQPYRDMQAVVWDALRELQGQPRPERNTASQSSDQWLRRHGRVSRTTVFRQYEEILDVMDEQMGEIYTCATLEKTLQNMVMQLMVRSSS